MEPTIFSKHPIWRNAAFEVVESLLRCKNRSTQNFVDSSISKLSKELGVSKEFVVKTLLLDKLLEEHQIQEEINRRVAKHLKHNKKLKVKEGCA